MAMAALPAKGSAMTATADLAIRLRRASFNRALADADLAAIGPILAQDVVMVTGTDSGVIAGRKEQLMAWKREFAAPDRSIYTRTPDTILVSPVEPIAFEHGQWRALPHRPASSSPRAPTPPNGGSLAASG